MATGFDVIGTVCYTCVTPVCYTQYVKTNQMPKERLMQAGLFFQQRVAVSTVFLRMPPGQRPCPGNAGAPPDGRVCFQ